MRIVIVGAGRMGIRHALGILNSPVVERVLMVDLSSDSLRQAKRQLGDHPHARKCSFNLDEDFRPDKSTQDAAIVASTASHRVQVCEKVLNAGIHSLMIEKPLGQSRREVEDCVDLVESRDVYGCVNLNKRMNPDYHDLRSKLHLTKQLAGPKSITINTGAIGIGTNGIHVLDLLFFLLNADKAFLVAGAVDDDIVPSGRGTEYCDFGGWCVTEFLGTEDEYLGRALVSLSSHSSAVGSWEIIAPHGRITFIEHYSKMTFHLRSDTSHQPTYRYGADYLQPVETALYSPFVGDYTRCWLEGLAAGERRLPCLRESLKAHHLMFDWLELSSGCPSGVYPIA